jgi:DNA-binding NarL/FixJ family response regulator
MAERLQNSGRLRALLIDDHPLVLNALTTALTSLGAFDGIDQDRSLGAALDRLARGSRYDLILLDLQLGDAVGAEAVVRLREQHPDMPIVIFSGDDSIATIRLAFEHGVLGYIPKSFTIAQIVNAIQVVLDGGSYLPPHFLRSMGFESGPRRPQAARDAAAGDAEPDAVPRLTPRQREVLGFLLQGMPNKVIADRLGMAEGTVKTHLYTIYRLFGASNRAQVIVKANQLGIR